MIGLIRFYGFNLSYDDRIINIPLFLKRKLCVCDKYIINS